VRFALSPPQPTAYSQLAGAPHKHTSRASPDPALQVQKDADTRWGRRLSDCQDECDRLRKLAQRRQEELARLEEDYDRCAGKLRQQRQSLGGVGEPCRTSPPRRRSPSPYQHGPPPPERRGPPSLGLGGGGGGGGGSGPGSDHDTKESDWPCSQVCTNPLTLPWHSRARSATHTLAPRGCARGFRLTARRSPQCNTANFGFRAVCNRCSAPRPAGPGGGRGPADGRDDGGRRDGGSGVSGWDQGGRGDQGYRRQRSVSPRGGYDRRSPQRDWRSPPRDQRSPPHDRRSPPRDRRSPPRGGGPDIRGGGPDTRGVCFDFQKRICQRGEVPLPRWLQRGSRESHNNRDIPLGGAPSPDAARLSRAAGFRTMRRRPPALARRPTATAWALARARARAALARRRRRATGPAVGAGVLRPAPYRAVPWGSEIRAPVG
jgi:hypothetical protein